MDVTFYFKLNRTKTFAKKDISVTQKLLKYHLHYDKTTGLFTWIRPRAWSVKIGSIAGNIDISVKLGSYVGIKLFGIKYKAHRLAWLYVTGEWPQHDIDHKDNNGINNAWSNLREANWIQNAQNRKAQSNNKTGYKGVSFDKKQNNYRATITVNKKWIYLGNFKTILEAAKVYKEMAKKYHKNFARY